MITLSPRVKFSDKLVVGSPEIRKQLVSGLNERLFNAVQPRLAQGPMSLQELREIYRSILPEDKNVKIFKLRKNRICMGLSDFIYGGGRIKGVTMELPANNNIITEDNLTTLMHENTHVLDALANPKTTLITQKNTLNGLYSPQRDKWFSEVLYTPEENIFKPIIMVMRDVKKKTLKFLEGLSTEDKIDILQDARYVLEQERNAYGEQLKYARRLKELGRPIKNSEIYNGDLIYMFTPKIQVLKSIIKELISKERKKISMDITT